MHNKLLDSRLRVLGIEHSDTIATMNNMCCVLTKLGRKDESLELQERVLEIQSKIYGEQHPNTVLTIFNVAMAQCNVRRFDDAHRNASRGLLLARKIDHEEYIAHFVEFLSRLAEIKEDADPTASVEQKRLREKIRLRKQQTDKKAVAEAARLANPQPPTTEAALDLLMAD